MLSRSFAIVVLLLVACDDVPLPRETPYDISARSLTAEDIAVYEALVAAYAEAGQVLGMAPPPPGHRRPLTLDEVRDRSTRTNNRLRAQTMARSGLPEELPADRWYTLADVRLPALRVPRSALRNFSVRNRRPASLDAYRSRHWQLERTNDRSIGSPFSSVATLTLPGYSPEGDAAVVEVWVSTSGLSGGAELLFLRKVNGAWKVVGKQQTMIS